MPTRVVTTRRPTAWYGDTKVEVMASDVEDLWTTQELLVRRNRPPVIRETNALPTGDTANQDRNFGRYGGAETANQVVVVGTAGDHKTLKIDTGDAFFYDDDQLMVTAEVEDESHASVTVDGDVITLTGLKGTEVGGSKTAGDTRILLRVTDSGGLKSNLLTFGLRVDTGPSVKLDKDGNQVASDVGFTLEAEGAKSFYVVDVERFFATQPAGSEVVGYTASSSDPSVVTVKPTLIAESGQGLTAGMDLVVYAHSLGESTITLTATEVAASANPRTTTGDNPTRYGDPIQKSELKFKVTIVAE